MKTRMKKQGHQLSGFVTIRNSNGKIAKMDIRDGNSSDIWDCIQYRYPESYKVMDDANIVDGAISVQAPLMKSDKDIAKWIQGGKCIKKDYAPTRYESDQINWDRAIEEGWEPTENDIREHQRYLDLHHGLETHYSEMVSTLRQLADYVSIRYTSLEALPIDVYDTGIGDYYNEDTAVGHIMFIDRNDEKITVYARLYYDGEIMVSDNHGMRITCHSISEAQDAIDEVMRAVAPEYFASARKNIRKSKYIKKTDSFIYISGATAHYIMMYMRCNDEHNYKLKEFGGVTYMVIPMNDANPEYMDEKFPGCVTTKNVEGVDCYLVDTRMYEKQAEAKHEEYKRQMDENPEDVIHLSSRKNVKKSVYSKRDIIDLIGSNGAYSGDPEDVYGYWYNLWKNDLDWDAPIESRTPEVIRAKMFDYFSKKLKR